MTDRNKNEPSDNKKDSRELAEFLKDARQRDLLFSNYIGVALSSYMHGINDAAKSFKAAQLA